MMDIISGIVSVTFGIPYIVSERCDRNNYPLGFKTSARRLVSKGAAAIIANSPVGAEFWHGHPRVIVIPNGIDLAGIAKVSPLVSQERRRPVVVCLARLTAQKNQARLIEAMAAVRERFPNALLQFLGEGPDRLVLECLVDRLGFRDHIEFLGFRQDAWSWLKSADLAVLVSHYEGSPNAALESAASGCPLVLSDIPAHRFAFSANEAVFVNKDDPGAIAGGILDLLSDADHRKRLASAASRRVAELTIEASLDQYLELYKEITRKQVKPTRVVMPRD